MTSNLTLYAVNESTGSQIWQFYAGPGSAVGGGSQPNLAVSGNRVFVAFATDSMGRAGLCAVNARTGKLEWSWAIYNDSGPVTSYADNGPTIAGGDVIMGEQDSNGAGHVGYVVDLDATTGAVIWMIGECGDNPANNLCYTVSSSPAAVAKGVFYVGAGGDGKFFNFTAGTCAHSMTDGSVLWCHQSNNTEDAVS